MDLLVPPLSSHYYLKSNCGESIPFVAAEWLFKSSFLFFLAVFHFFEQFCLLSKDVVEEEELLDPREVAFSKKRRRRNQRIIQTHKIKKKMHTRQEMSKMSFTQVREEKKPSA